MDEVLRETILSLAAFLAIFGMVYVFLMTRHKERMTMLEKGVDASHFQAKPKTSLTLKYGMLFVGIAIGILAGHVLNFYCSLDGTVAFVSMIFLFGGLGLIINYTIEKKNAN